MPRIIGNLGRIVKDIIPILFASGNLDPALTFAAITVLCVVGLALYGSIVLTERAVNRWIVSTVSR